MSRVFLKNGQEVELIEELSGGKHLAREIIVLEDYEGYEFQDYGNNIVITEYYKNPPVKMINKEVKEAERKLSLKRKEISDLDSQIRQKKRELEQSTKLDKYIINRKHFIDSKEIVAWSKGSVMPITRKNSNGIKLSTTLVLRTGEENSWVYKLYDDYESCPNYIGQDGIILFDPSKEEIDAEISRRVEKIDVTKLRIDRAFLGIPDKYLTDELKKKKEDFIVNERTKKIDKKEGEIEKLKLEIEGLKTSRTF